MILPYLPDRGRCKLAALNPFGKEGKNFSRED